MLKKKLNLIILMLMPMCLISSGFVNMVLFYLGLHAYDDIRKLVSIIILCIFFLLSLLKLLFLYQDYPAKRKKIIALCFIPVLWILAFAAALFQFGIKREILFTLGTFGIYCIPAFIFAISIAIERTEESFIKGFKWYAVIIAPLMAYFIIRFFITSGFVYKLNCLGDLVYLVIGYTLVPILIFCIIDLYLHKSDYYGLKIGLIILLWIACIFTGARGPLICMLVFLVLFTIYLLLQKEKNKTIFCLFAVMSVVLVLSFAYPPPSSGTYRTNQLIKDLKHDKIRSGVMPEKDKELVSELAENASPAKGIQVELKKTNKTVRPWDRMFLYKMAINEGNKAPLTGLGPMGYILKYGWYPHNVILELIADFGYLAAALFVLIILVLLFLLYKKGKHDKFAAYMLLFFIAWMPKEMLSGTIYNSVVLLFAIGYVCALPKSLEKPTFIKHSGIK